MVFVMLLYVRHILYCIILYYIVLYCIGCIVYHVLYCIVLNCIILFLYYIVVLYYRIVCVLITGELVDQRIIKAYGDGQAMLVSLLLSTEEVTGALVYFEGKK